MPSDSTVGNSKTPGQAPIPRGPWSVEDHHGAPRAARPRRIAWFVLTTLPGTMLALAGWGLWLADSGGASWVTALAYTFAGCTIAATVWTSRNTYRRGYYIGSLQTLLDKAEGRPIDDTLDRPEPHPADPGPVPPAYLWPDEADDA